MQHENLTCEESRWSVEKAMVGYRPTSHKRVSWVSEGGAGDSISGSGGTGCVQTSTFKLQLSNST